MTTNFTSKYTIKDKRDILNFYIAKCALILGMTPAELKQGSPSILNWWYCCCDGTMPEEAVAEYLKYIRTSKHGNGA